MDKFDHEIAQAVAELEAVKHHANELIRAECDRLAKNTNMPFQAACSRLVNSRPELRKFGNDYDRSNR